MDRINHVKIVTPDPVAVDTFLREVMDFPQGWNLEEPPPSGGEIVGPARNPDGTLSLDGVMAWRGEGTGGGVITGSPESRQFQIFAAAEPKIWSVALGTRNIERAHERCLERGLPCTELNVTGWHDRGIQFFFVEVGGIVFEVMRIQDEPQ